MIDNNLDYKKNLSLYKDDEDEIPLIKVNKFEPITKNVGKDNFD